MLELLEAAFSGVNIVYSMLLILVLIYWCIVILGVLDLDAFDLDADVDVGGDFDLDGDIDAGVEGTEGAFSWLAFFNVGEVPIMFFVTIVALTMWVVSVQANSVLDKHATGWVADHRGLVAAALAVPNLIFALFLAKFLVLPVKKMRQRPAQVTKLEGKVCLVTSPEVTDKYGWCETPKEEGSLILNARTQNGEILKKGDAAEVIEHVVGGDEDFYVVTKKIWDDA
jgi:hypothetical protein